MKHNDIRHSLCYGCVCFAREEFSGKYICAENGQHLRVGKHKIPLKHQECKGPHDDWSTVIRIIDELHDLSDETRNV